MADLYKNMYDSNQFNAFIHVISQFPTPMYVSSHDHKQFKLVMNSASDQVKFYYKLISICYVISYVISIRCVAELAVQYWDITIIK